MHSANALSSTVNNIFLLFSKFLTKMLQNGVLKTYTFLYTEDYSNIEENYDNIMNEINDLKDVILKLYSDATLTRKDIIPDDSFNMLHADSLNGCVPTNAAASYASHTADGYSLYSTTGIDDSVDENIPYVSANENAICNSMAPNMNASESSLCDRLPSPIDFVGRELSTTSVLEKNERDLNFAPCDPLTEMVEENGQVSHNVAFSAFKDNENTSMRTDVNYLDNNGSSVKINDVDNNMAALDSMKYSDCNNSLYMTLKEAISGDFLQNMKFNSANENDDRTVTKNMHYNQEVPDYPSCSAPNLHIDLDILSNSNERINHALDRIFDDQFVGSDPLLEPECWSVDINLPNSDPVPSNIGLQNDQFNLPACAKNMEPKNATDLLSTYRNDSSATMNGNEHANLVSTLNDLNESISNNLNNSACMSNTLDSITQDKYCADDFNRSKYFCEHCQFVCNTKLKLKLHLKKLHNVYVNNIHECDECGKTFKDRTILVTHKRIHQEIKPYKCQFCWKTFTQKITLNSHLSLHTGLYKYSCSTCQKKFPTLAKLNFHAKSHEKPEWSCDICSKMFTTKQYLSMHKKSHNKPLPTPIKCLTCIKCSMIFEKNVDLLQHLKEYHPDVNFTCYYTDCNRSYSTYKKLRDHIYKKHTVKKQPQSKVGSEKIYVKCQLCGLNFTNKNSYHRHNLLNHRDEVDTENSFGCTQCEKRFASEAGQREHMQKFHCASPPQDASCSNLFYEKSALKEHMNGHSDFDSHLCGSIFSDKSEFLVHSSGHESKNAAISRKHKCDTCEQTFENKMELKQHELDVHNILPKLEELKPYGCTFCDKRFTTRGKCNLHIETHSENRKYECTKCQKRFYRRDLLKEHLMTHDGYRKFVCGICGLGFSQKSSLKTHETTHSIKEEHTCDRCGKVFLSKQALNYHVRTHDGDFKFACEICGKKFVRKCHYDLHIMCHSNERPFRCLKCAISYKTSKHLRDHFRKTHQNEADFDTLMNSIYDNEVMTQQSILNDFIPAISTL